MKGNKVILAKRELILEQGHRTYSLLRSATFSGEFHLLQAFTYLFKKFGELPTAYQDATLKPLLINDIKSLYEMDARLFRQGICPWSLLVPESPFQHAKRLAQIMIAGVGMSRLRKLRQTKTKETAHDVPEYYQRHYHWQQGGYLTESSALLYDHQVEILFKGTGAAMRRLLMGPLHAFLSQQNSSAKILEVGAGTGLAAYEVHHSFPFHSLTVSELSGPYLKQARSRLNAAGVDFIRADATALPFGVAEFDVLYTTFMFHELPRQVREAALKEFARVLRPGGLLIIVDSIQQGDVAEYSFVLEKFPQDYHEPFYKDYSLWPLDDALKRHDFVDISVTRGFFAKCVTGTKA